MDGGNTNTNIPEKSMHKIQTRSHTYTNNHEYPVLNQTQITLTKKRKYSVVNSTQTHRNPNIRAYKEDPLDGKF